jgi:hypothetical protein
MNEEWQAWGEKVEARLAKIEKFVTARKDDVRFKGTGEAFHKYLEGLAQIFDDFLELRIWHSLAKRFSEQADDELGRRYESIIKGFCDEKDLPSLDDRKAYADAAADAIKSFIASRYQGVWDASKTYDAGMFVTHDGSAWACLKGSTTGVRPGANGCWQLAVKKGRDLRA